MTNISPQKPNLNRKLWQRLEEVEVNYFTQLAPTIWVITGPVFDDKIERLKTAWHVEIPDAFYKIYAMLTPDKQVHLLAFLVPQTVKGDEALDRYLVTVDKIEALTGLDFFYELDDTEETALESTLNSLPWQLKTVNSLPARY
jgi:endonuclease G